MIEEDELDFGDESFQISLAGEAPSRAITSFDVHPDANRILDRPVFSSCIPQREWIDKSKGDGWANAASAANMPKLRDELTKHLLQVPCLVIHCGDFEYDFTSMMHFALGLSDASKGKLPVAFCSDEARGRRVVGVSEIPNLLLNGCSVFYRLVTPPHANRLAEQLSIFAGLARQRNVSIEPMRLIVVIDKAMSCALASKIRSVEDDRNYVSYEHAAADVTLQYLPQVERNVAVVPTGISKSWETHMEGHIFRNTHQSPTRVSTARFPLDYLGFFLAFHPAGQSYVLANMLLPENGEKVRSLIESWVNAILGTPLRFIAAS